MGSFKQGFHENSLSTLRRRLLTAKPVGQRRALHSIAEDVDGLALASHFVNADDAGMLKLRGGAGGAQELLGLLAAELALAGNLRRHRAVQHRIAGFPHRAERPHADAVDQFKMADFLDRRRLMANGLITQQVKAAAARGAMDLIERIIAQNFDRIATKTRTKETQPLMSASLPRLRATRNTLLRNNLAERTGFVLGYRPSP